MLNALTAGSLAAVIGVSPRLAGILEI